MSIPFRATGADDGHAAAFLRVIRDEGGGYDGVLFVMNARGEPLEFVSSRVETPRTRLWRRPDLRRRAARELTAALFTAATSRPVVVFARADEVDADFFVTDIETPVATCLVDGPVTSVGEAADRRSEGGGDEGPRLLWSSGPPAEGSAARALVESLRRAGLLTEPFERAEAGLREAQGEDSSGCGSVL